VLAARAAHVRDAPEPRRAAHAAGAGLPERGDQVRVRREVDPGGAMEPGERIGERTLERLGARIVHPREPGGHVRQRLHLEPSRFEEAEQLLEIEALLVLDPLPELQERVLGEVAREPIQAVVERRRARHRQVEGAAGLRDARQLVAAGGELGNVLEHVVTEGEVERALAERQPGEVCAQHAYVRGAGGRAGRELDVEADDPEIRSLAVAPRARPASRVEHARPRWRGVDQLVEEERRLIGGPDGLLRPRRGAVVRGAAHRRKGFHSTRRVSVSAGSSTGIWHS
jgi:hypothetical protein